MPTSTVKKHFHGSSVCCFVLGIVAALSFSCGGTQDSSVRRSTGHTTATGGTSAAAGAPATESTSCGMPIYGASGVPKPTGAASKLTVLDWAGFKGAVTYTFDDANTSQISNYAALNALGVHLTFYLQTGKSSAANQIWAQAVLDGHELGNHTENHAQTATEADIDAASTFIQNTFGVRAWTMASPYGDASYVNPAKSRFLINRGVTNAPIRPNDGSDPFNLPCFIPPQAAATADFNKQIDSALSAGAWRVVLVHGFVGGSDSAYQPVDIAQFTASVEYAKSLGTMWIDSMVNVGSYWRAQKLISAIAPVAESGGQSWSWTLPPNFPPGKCLRVTTDGGVLKQAGAAVPWNDHGFYEISLDAGAVTLAAE
jgi:peptidoglycan/xylan/chitin deacetylase (PgdA/CDA1 family)